MITKSTLEAIRSRHKLGADAEVKVMSSVLTVKADGDHDPYKFTARITTDSLDRQDEVVIPQGGDLTEFLTCGAWFFNHDYAQPVGFPNKAKKIVRGDNFIECGGVFMKKPMDWDGVFPPDLAREFVTQAYANGISPGVSIGFVPLESRRATKADVARWGERVQVVHSKWKLLEVSIAPVQANQDAFVVTVGKAVNKPAPKPAPKVIHETLCLIRHVPAPKVDIAAIAKEEARKAILKAFGRVYA